MDDSSSSYFDTVSEVFESWDTIKRIPDYEEVVGLALFDKMFESAPDAWGIFRWRKEDFAKKDPQCVAFAKKFVRMLDLAVHMLGPEMDIVEQQMYDLGKQHQRYGVMPKHFFSMGKALESTLANILGRDFTYKTREAWKDVFHFMSTSMIMGASGSCEA
ncbi:bacterial hemoglobin [Seminavis robusta]|uniref:Bacterial hemoglobin n=1 Tax=Seminavis robusta TaxID=568900 RepID=A0A9N8HM54_9STRA|nr:bacterial hemoglobin [Seminavis robusta]|eukprot:Sro879_g214910.1 bacterial hemoglobin (160) ;mRNA; f:36233-36817